MHGRVTMDFFQHRYYRINKMLLTTIGQWPYQSTRAKYSLFAVQVVVTASLGLPQLMAFVKYIDDWEFLLESASPFIFELALIVKVLFSIWNSQKMLILFNHIRDDWNAWGHQEEIKIIHEYAEQGRKMTIMYTVMVVTTNILFTIPPVVAKIIDMTLKNGSKPGELSIPVYYYNLDMQKYYFYISMHCFVCVSVGAFVTIAIDSRLIIFVQHGCGLFAAVGYVKNIAFFKIPRYIVYFVIPRFRRPDWLSSSSRYVRLFSSKSELVQPPLIRSTMMMLRHKLQRSAKNLRSIKTEDIGYTSNTGDMDFEHIVSCIKGHNDAIEYTKLIETIYSWCFFFLVGCNMLIISVVGIQILKRANDPGENTRFIVFLVANMAHLYMENYMSQILMDHSIDIRCAVHNGKWYRLSQRAQKLLILMTMRCNVPCELTIGKISSLSFKSFMTILQASMSYFTLLRSV